MPEDTECIEAAYEATMQGFVKCIFVGNTDIMTDLINKNSLKNFAPEMIDARTPEEAAFKTVELIRNKKASAIMKGVISTPILLKAILNSQTGIKDSNVLSHTLIYEADNSLKFITDGGMIPQPDLKALIEIIKNSAKVAKKFGFKKIKVGVISTSDTVDPQITSSLNAAILAQMSAKGQFGDDIIVDGPFTLDSIISEDAANIKGVKKSFDGTADVIVGPDIDTVNIFAKSLIYYGNVQCGGLIVGAKCPVVLLSRADTKEIKLNSIKLALAAGVED